MSATFEDLRSLVDLVEQGRLSAALDSLTALDEQLGQLPLGLSAEAADRLAAALAQLQTQLADLSATSPHLGGLAAVGPYQEQVAQLRAELLQLGAAGQTVGQQLAQSHTDHQAAIDRTRSQLKKLEKQLEGSVDPDQLVQLSQEFGRLQGQMAAQQAKASRTMQASWGALGQAQAAVVKGMAQAHRTSESQMTAVTKQEQGRRVQALRSGLQVGLELTNLLAQVQASRSREALELLDLQRDQDLAAAGDNALAREKIEEDYRRRREEGLRRQARHERNTALYTIALETAVNLVRAALDPFQTALAVAQGAAQAAIVTATPLPQYFRGTDSAPGGLAWVGERGAELVVPPGGQPWLSPGGPTLVDLPRGSRVVPHAETEQVLRSQRHQLDADRLAQALGREIRQLPVTEVNLTEQGLTRYIRRAGHRTQYLDAQRSYT